MAGGAAASAADREVRREHISLAPTSACARTGIKRSAQTYVCTRVRACRAWASVELALCALYVGTRPGASVFFPRRSGSAPPRAVVRLAGSCAGARWGCKIACDVSVVRGVYKNVGSCAVIYSATTHGSASGDSIPSPVRRRRPNSDRIAHGAGPAAGRQTRENCQEHVPCAARARARPARRCAVARPGRRWPTAEFRAPAAAPAGITRLRSVERCP